MRTSGFCNMSSVKGKICSPEDSISASDKSELHPESFNQSPMVFRAAILMCSGSIMMTNHFFAYFSF